MAIKNLINRLKALEETAGMGKRVTLERLIAASFGLVTLNDVNPDDPLCRAIMEVKCHEC
jgi:hypothetical protein